MSHVEVYADILIASTICARRAADGSAEGDEVSEATEERGYPGNPRGCVCQERYAFQVLCQHDVVKPALQQPHHRRAGGGEAADGALFGEDKQAAAGGASEQDLGDGKSVKI